MANGSQRFFDFRIPVAKNAETRTLERYFQPFSDMRQSTLIFVLNPKGEILLAMKKRGF